MLPHQQITADKKKIYRIKDCERHTSIVQYLQDTTISEVDPKRKMNRNTILVSSKQLKQSTKLHIKYTYYLCFTKVLLHHFIITVPYCIT